MNTEDIPADKDALSLRDLDPQDPTQLAKWRAARERRSEELLAAQHKRIVALGIVDAEGKLTDE